MSRRGPSQCGKLQKLVIVVGMPPYGLQFVLSPDRWRRRSGASASHTCHFKEIIVEHVAARSRRALYEMSRPRAIFEPKWLRARILQFDVP